MAALPIVFGSPEWIARNEAEVASRPQTIPLDKRHYWTPAELERIRNSVQPGMNQNQCREVVGAVAELSKQL